ncbi:MAG: hypothetical protein AAGI90_06575 [Chlamydiota bacterium]
MTRISKQKERRARCPRKRKVFLDSKTGPKKDALELGYKEHINSVTHSDPQSFIPRIK